MGGAFSLRSRHVFNYMACTLIWITCIIGESPPWGCSGSSGSASSITIATSTSIGMLSESSELRADCGVCSGGKRQLWGAPELPGPSRCSDSCRATCDADVVDSYFKGKAPD